MERITDPRLDHLERAPGTNVPTWSEDVVFTEDVSVTGDVEVQGALQAASVEATDGFHATGPDGILTDRLALSIDGYGASIVNLEELVSLVSAGAKFKAMAAAIPAGSVILSALANIQSTVVAGGTTVKIALGLNGGDVDAYGISSGFAKNAKITTIPDWAVLSGATTIDVCGVVTNGSALGDSNFTAGSVLVRITYLKATALPDAA